MNKLTKIFLSLTLLFSLSLGTNIATTEVEASTKYKNCAQLNKAFPNGVSVKAGTKNKVTVTKTVKKKKTTVVEYKVSKAKVNAAVYKVNKGLDRDGDGIACEK